MTSLKFLQFLKDKLETPYVVSYFLNRLLAKTAITHDPAVAFVPTLPWERRFRLDLGAGRGTGTGGTRGRVCEVAGVGGEGFVNPKRDSTTSVIDWARPVYFDRVKIASRMTGFGFGRLFEACFGALAGLVAPRLSFAPWFVPVGG